MFSRCFGIWYRANITKYANERAFFLDFTEKQPFSSKKKALFEDLTKNQLFLIKRILSLQFFRRTNHFLPKRNLTLVCEYFLSEFGMLSPGVSETFSPSWIKSNENYVLQINWKLVIDPLAMFLEAETLKSREIAEIFVWKRATILV